MHTGTLKQEVDWNTPTLVNWELSIQKQDIGLHQMIWKAVLNYTTTNLFSKWLRFLYISVSVTRKKTRCSQINTI